MCPVAFELHALPYAQDTLAPHIRAETLEFLHGKRYQIRVTKLSAAAEGRPAADKSLGARITGASGGIFNSVAQSWTHAFDCHSLSPNGGGRTKVEVLAAIERDFGFVEACTQQLSNAVGTHFGSGWARLVFDSGTLKGLATHDAASTMADGQVPLMTIDA